MEDRPLDSGPDNAPFGSYPEVRLEEVLRRINRIRPGKRTSPKAADNGNYLARIGNLT
jgi:hypothetical protein